MMMERAQATRREAPVLASRFLPRVLIAEDDEDLLRLAAFHLRRDGYRVTGVRRGSELLADLEASHELDPPALVISDHRMPGMTGFEALARVRDWGWTLPLVLITAFGDEELERRARRLGVTLMSKPFDMDDLRTLVGYLAPRRG